MWISRRKEWAGPECRENLVLHSSVWLRHKFPDSDSSISHSGSATRIATTTTATSFPENMTSAMSQQNFSMFKSNEYDTNLIKDEIEELKKKMGVTGRIIPRPDAFEVDMDISGYEPEEVNVTVKGNILTISGSHEVRGADGFTYSSRNFSRTYTIPEDIIKERIRSIILADGHTMKIEAPSRFVANGVSDDHKMRA